MPRSYGDLYVSFDPNNKWLVPTIYNWNLLIERQLPSGFLCARIRRLSHQPLGETINLTVPSVRDDSVHCGREET